MDRKYAANVVGGFPGSLAGVKSGPGLEMPAFSPSPKAKKLLELIDSD